MFTTQHEMQKGKELYLPHRISYKRKQMQRPKLRGKYMQTPTEVAFAGRNMGWGGCAFKIPTVVIYDFYQQG